MNIHFKGTKYEPTAEVIAHANSKIEPLAKFINEDNSEALAFIELDRAVGNQNQGDVWRAELTITHEGNRFRAESTKTKLDHAITTVARDVGRELRRAKGKDQTLFKKGGSAIKGLLRGFRK